VTERLACVTLIAAAIGLLDAQAPHAASESASRTRALAWLTSQVGPRFAARQHRTARLIDSYEDSRRVGWTYDAALASITFAAAGERDLAAELLAGLEHLQYPDGSWVSAYHPDEATPRGPERHVGAIAWGVMAANFYESDTGDDRYAPMARRAITYLLRFRIADPTSDLMGAFAMGPARPRNVSTEHNLDCYAAFAWRGRLDRDPVSLEIAAGIRAAVFRRLFEGRFFHVGSTRDVLHLDAQSWAALAFSDSVADERIDAALRTAERVLAVTGARRETVSGIVGLDDAERPHASRKVWAEGTEGMVAALITRGEVVRAERLHRETSRYQAASGGIPYATENDHGWSTAPAVASTAWYVLNALTPPRNPFNPGL
jgi:hypothetical protein